MYYVCYCYGKENVKLANTLIESHPFEWLKALRDEGRSDNVMIVSYEELTPDELVLYNDLYPVEDGE